MTEFDMIFYTDYYLDGYQLGINMQIDKGFLSDEYSKLYDKIATVFRSFNYGMDIAKITEVLKTVLINNGVEEEKISRLYISLVNKKADTQSTDIIGVKNGSLNSVMYEYDLYKYREVLSIAYDHGKLYSYYYRNGNKEFIFKNNKLHLEYNDLPEKTKTRNGILNRMLKDNLKVIQYLENVKGDKLCVGSTNINDTILVSAYRLFFGENPDFNKPGIVTKIQCMAAILTASGIDMFPSVSEHNYGESDITCPESIYIRDQIFKLTMLLGNNFSKVEKFTFKPNISKKIELLGTTIREYMSNLPEEERMSFLSQFAINYLHAYSIYGNKLTEVMDERSQELMRLLTKKESNN